jgi:hypothetical protein
MYFSKELNMLRSSKLAVFYERMTALAGVSYLNYSMGFNSAFIFIFFMSLHTNNLPVEKARAISRNSSSFTEAVAKRIERSATIQLNGTIEEVFPLFGALREKDWASGWNPEIVFTQSGAMEEHMVFRTPATHRDADYYLWVVTRYETSNHRVEYMVSTRERIWFITVLCQPSGPLTSATVTYSYIGLTDDGARINEEALKKMYAQNLKDWEEAINFYLSTGKKLE